MTRATAVLLALAVGTLIARASIFSEGDTAGAWITVVLFWACSLGALVSSAVRAIHSPRPRDRLAVAQLALGAIAFVSFAVAGFVETWLANDMFALSLLGLMLVTLVRSRARRSS